MIYTVICLNEDTGLVVVDHVSIENHNSPHEAMLRAARNSATPGSLQILGALPGKHDFIAACEDSGKSAYASDLNSI